MDEVTAHAGPLGPDDRGRVSGDRVPFRARFPPTLTVSLYNDGSLASSRVQSGETLSHGAKRGSG